MSIDIQTGSNVAVALATGLLALATYLLVRQSRRQMTQLSKQTILTQAQLRPVFKLEDVSVHDNTIHLSLTNIGSGIANLVALESDFVPTRYEFYDGPKAGSRILDKSEIASIEKTGGKAWMRYAIDIREVSIGSTESKELRKSRPHSCATFLVNKKWNDALLLPSERAEFEVSPYFELRGTKGDSFKFAQFAELKNILEANGMRAVTVSFHIKAKDLAENPGLLRHLGTFVVDFSKHDDLEAGYKENFRPDFMALSPDEIVQRMGYMEGDLYNEGKTSINVPETK